MMKAEIQPGLRSTDGQGLTEYLMIVLLVAVVSIAATRTLGRTVKMKLQEARNKINQEVVLD